MSDVTAVKEALSPDLIGFDGRGNVTLPQEAFELVHAAARAYVRMIEAGVELKDATIRDKRGKYRSGDFLVVPLSTTGED